MNIIQLVFGTSINRNNNNNNINKIIQYNTIMIVQIKNA